VVANAVQFGERVRQKRAGELMALRVVSAGTAPRVVNVPVQRRACRAQVFDPSFYGNALIAKLTVANILATSAADRDLLGFSLALGYMRFGAYRQALDLLNALGSVTEGLGVGKGAVLFFKARCLEALGERDNALAAYKDASNAGEAPLADDGASVATLARRRMAALGRTP